MFFSVFFFFFSSSKCCAVITPIVRITHPCLSAEDTSTINTLLYNTLYNFLLVSQSHTVGQLDSHLFSFWPTRLAPFWQPTSSAYMCACSAPGWGLSHLQANYGRYLFSGRNKLNRIKFSAALFLDSILVCWANLGDVVFLALRILHRCLEINPKAPWLTARRIVLSICWHAC